MAKKAFIIGINTLGLKYSQKDASLMNECLSKYGYEVIMAGNRKTEILNQFDDFIDRAMKIDTLIFYFSGHGYASKGKLLLVLNDDIFKNKSIISISHITEAFENCRARDKLIILDCCKAGVATDDWNPEQSERIRMLTASERLQKGKELDELHASFLTYYIHQGIINFSYEIIDQDNKIRINELDEWLETKAQQHNAKPHAIQVPIPNLLGNHKANFEIAVIQKENVAGTLHSICKKIIREQIKTVGHDKYIPDIYIRRSKIHS